MLVPEPWVLEYFCLLMPIKLGIASGFFAIMLKKLFGQDDLSITLFGCFYGMCAWHTVGKMPSHCPPLPTQ